MMDNNGAIRDGVVATAGVRGPLSIIRNRLNSMNLAGRRQRVPLTLSGGLKVTTPTYVKFFD